MKIRKKTVALIVLALLEVAFVSWVFTPVIPRRSADVDAFRAYQKEPTEESKQLWLKERQTTQSEVRLRVSLGVCLAAGNLLLIGWIARRRTISPTSGNTLGSTNDPLDTR